MLGLIQDRKATGRAPCHGLFISRIGQAECLTFEACSVRLLSDKKSRKNCPECLAETLLALHIGPIFADERINFARRR
jgi:hypothetical protein